MGEREVGADAKEAPPLAQARLVPGRSPLGSSDAGANAHHHRAAAALSSPTSSRLSAHTVSRLNHVRDTARKPNQR